MDKYGYVSNNYHGHAMAGQTRAIAGVGGCRCSSYHRHQQMHMPASQPSCSCRHKSTPIMTQPSAGIMFSQEGREWTTSKAGCFEHCGSCCCAFFCLWCFNCYLANKMDEAVCGPLCNPLGPCCGCRFMVALRTRLRTVNGIEGSVCKDMCAYTFCACCTSAQMFRELKNTDDDM